MNCATARRLLSDRIDDPTDADHHDLDAHLAACADCQGVARRLDGIRRYLHLQPVGSPPDVAPRVRAALEERSTSRWRDRALLPVAAAAFVTAFALSAAVVGLSGSPPAEATDVSTLVLEGQAELSWLSADVEVVEHGWHPEVPTRRYTGSLSYVAPETLVLEIADRTSYPDGRWRPNDVTLVVDGELAWGSGFVGCPPAAQPDCTADEPRVRAVAGREPFDRVDPVPLDLVLPVASFVVSGSERPLGEAQVAGRDAIGVAVTAAQIAPLLEGIERHGNWRPIHPTDDAEVWLDAELGVPLQVEVRVAAGFERDRWAAANGLDEPDGDPVLTWRLARVQVNEPIDVSSPELPEGVTVDDRGFRGAPAGVVVGPEPQWLPDGMALHRAGRIGDVDVASYTDGRAWVTVRSTSDWSASRLFGQPTSVVRAVDLDVAGVGYVPEGGERVLLHGSDLDVEVVGSLPTDELIEVAASLGVQGQPVPPGWAEASTTTLDEAADAWPGLLTLPAEELGYARPGVSESDRGVAQTFAGAGSRGFVLTQTPGDDLGPPVDAVVLAVEVRDRQARHTPDRGTLEWVEDGRVVTLRSRTLSLAELIAVAETLEPVGDGQAPGEREPAP